MKTISFTGGIFITYLILHLLPQVYQENLFMTRVAVMSLLIGFALFHTLEKYIYQHESGPRLKKDLRRAHSIMFFAYHIIIGIILVTLTRFDLVSGVLLFIPIFLFTAISSISLKEIHEIITEKRKIRFLLSISTLIGVLIGIYLEINAFMYNILFGFVVGTLLYIIVVESLPKEREGNPFFFIFGIIIYTIIIALTWVV